MTTEFNPASGASILNDSEIQGELHAILKRHGFKPSRSRGELYTVYLCVIFPDDDIDEDQSTTYRLSRRTS